MCNIDEKVMTKAVWKILQNAIHALTDQDLHRDERRIEFSLIPQPDRVVIRISDNGLGMSEEVAAKANEPLFSTRGFGVGLGIPFAEQSVQQHDGGLSLKSTEGVGTTVEMWLPRADCGTDQQAA